MPLYHKLKGVRVVQGDTCLATEDGAVVESNNGFGRSVLYIRLKRRPGIADEMLTVAWDARGAPIDADELNTFIHRIDRHRRANENGC